MDAPALHHQTPPVMATFDSFREWRHQREQSGVSSAVHFVPTMGALHQGHGALIRTARAAAGEDGEVVVSVYVNPTQFNDAGDLAGYPRTREADEALAQAAGADVVVFPKAEEMYPGGVPNRAAAVDFGPLTRLWEAAHRPGHFDGVVAVVRTLFLATRPEAAYFGEKDWQQLAVIQTLVEREFPGLNVVPVPTVRQDDGLAMSSRNTRLSESGRTHAVALHQALKAIVDSKGHPEAVSMARAELETSGFEVEYLAVVDAGTLSPDAVPGRPRRVIVAAHLDQVRLIDNMGLEP